MPRLAPVSPFKLSWHLHQGEPARSPPSPRLCMPARQASLCVAASLWVCMWSQGLPFPLRLRGTPALQVGLKVLELQRRLPKARVVYCSATGASEARNMGYMERLGLWGKGNSAFADFSVSSAHTCPGCAAVM